MRDLWQVFNVLRESPDFAAEDVVGDFLHNCSLSDPDVARDVAVLHNQYADELKLQGPTDITSLPPHASQSDTISPSNPPISEVPTSLLQHQASQPIKDSNDNDKENNDEESEIQSSDSSTKPHEALRAETKPLKNDNPQWQANIDRFMKAIFLPQPVDISKFLNTVPFRVFSDPNFLEFLPHLIQCYMRMLDSKFCQEEGTSAKHLEATAAMIQQA